MSESELQVGNHTAERAADVSANGAEAGVSEPETVAAADEGAQDALAAEDFDAAERR